MSRNILRAKLKRREQTHGLWVSLESPSITEIGVTLGMDWVCIDMEHGHLDFKDVMEHLRVVRGTETSVLVRVPEINQSAIKRVLDMGAHGVILPLVRTAADLEAGFLYARYPLTGVRGIGGERAVKWGLGFEDYLVSANEEILVIPLIETRDAAENIDAILDVKGLEAIFFGPADFSASYGYLGEWEGPGVAQHILDIRVKAESKGIAAGLMSRSTEDSLQRAAQGFNMIGLGSDFGLMIRALNDNLKALNVDVTPHLWF